MKPHLSIIIPAFNESRRIAATLQKLDAYLAKQRYPREILVVDDGSTDDTVQVVNTSRISGVRVISSEKNLGKGAAVRSGMVAARGEIRLFMDADGSTGIEEIEKLEPFLSEGYDVVIGSRRTAGASILVRQNPIREFLGFLYRFLVRTLTPSEFEDTQNGFKLFSAAAADSIFGELRTNGWSFDIEILLLAKRNGFRVKEVPVAWANNSQSRMTFAGMLRMAIDLWKIRSRLRATAHQDAPINVV